MEKEKRDNETSNSEIGLGSFVIGYGCLVGVVAMIGYGYGIWLGVVAFLACVGFLYYVLFATCCARDLVQKTVRDELKKLHEEITELKKEKALYNAKGEKVDQTA